MVGSSVIFMCAVIFFEYEIAWIVISDPGSVSSGLLYNNVDPYTAHTSYAVRFYLYACLSFILTDAQSLSITTSLKLIVVYTSNENKLNAGALLKKGIKSST